MSFSKKSIQAIEAVIYIACATGPGPVASKEIGAALGLPARHLEQILQRLVRAGVLRGMRGPRGGYHLARERRRVSVADICTALREEGAAEPHTPLAQALVLPLIREAEEKALEFLRGATLAELCARAGTLKPKSPKRAGSKVDFNI